MQEQQQEQWWNVWERQQDAPGQIIKQTEMAKELNTTPVLDKIQEYRRF